MNKNKDYYIAKLLDLCVKEGNTTIKTASDAYPLLSPYGFKDQEHFIVLTLDGSHTIIKSHVVSIGILNKCVVHPREVFRTAIADNASAILIAHNHPSGTLTPSTDDIGLTKRLADAGEIIGISILDHIIVTSKAYYSFLESGKLLN